MRKFSIISLLFIQAVFWTGIPTCEAQRIDTDSRQAKNLTGLVSAATALIEEKGEKAFFEFNKKGTRWFNNYTYLIVFDLKGRVYVYPKDFSKVGSQISNIRASDNTPFLTDILKKLSLPFELHAWRQYPWRESEGSEPAIKIWYFAKAFPSSGKVYIVGSGKYGIPEVE